jgi:hypothetical protein
MAARGSDGLLLCVSLLLAMPALAATPTDRGECAASADKPDVGFAACSRIIDDANVPVAERVNAFKNWGRGPFNGKDCDRAIADYGAGLPDVVEPFTEGNGLGQRRSELPIS